MTKFTMRFVATAMTTACLWSGVPASAESPAAGGEIDFAEGRKFWSFQPLSPDAPVRRGDSWGNNWIDDHVLAELEENGLTPSPPAGRRALIRRVTYDLTGLPPTPAEVSAFLEDKSDEAYGRLVERLLSSQHFGEHWARMWLDLARYTDVRERWIVTHASPYVYRDWVVRALNEDVPYDQFVRRQLATDLMEETGVEDMPALGFLGVSPVYHKELLLAPEVIKTIVAEEWEERIDTVGRTFLGLTVACARCHDHKSDPISVNDYYALAGVFASIRRADRAALPEAEAKVAERGRKEVAKQEKEIKRLRELKPPPEDLAAQVAKLEARVRELRETTPNIDRPLVPAVIESSIHVVAKEDFGTKLAYKPGEPRDLAVQLRGDPNTPGPVVKRRFLRVLAGDRPRAFSQGSGRLELADSFFREGAALSARVIVNRIWLQHFGRGLVTTPSDFGREGARPSHPDLLEALAARFIEKGWSMKWLHREILLSATYQQASAHRPQMYEVDPDNQWLWRMSRRRLQVEAWRDAMLSVSGSLDLTVGGPPQELASAENTRRTIYGLVDRRDLEPVLQINDFPDPSTHSPAREKTITPLQQLFVLNGEFMRRHAEALVSRLTGAHPGDEAAQIRLAHELLYARPATEGEIALALEFLSAEGADRHELRVQYAQVLLGANEFLFID